MSKKAFSVPLPTGRDKLLIRCASVLCVGVLLLPCPGWSDDGQQQLKSLQQDIAEKEKSVREQQQRRSALLEQLKKQEQSIAQSTRQLRDTRSTLERLNQDIGSLNASIAKLQTQQKTQETLLAKQLDAAFRQGQHGALQLILSGEESQRRERILAYFNYLNQ
ncbi:murein hydrolase activator EnvC, partial [Dickeya dadantii]|nr:murein hydrolase activator EnvC [Dickeya dadantii]